MVLRECTKTSSRCPSYGNAAANYGKGRGCGCRLIRWVGVDYGFGYVVAEAVEAPLVEAGFAVRPAFETAGVADAGELADDI